MRSSYLIAFAIILVGAGVYWYQATASVCPVPLSYRLGTIDPSFSLSPEQARVYAAEAEAVWEDTVGRNLFTYDESAAFTIDFVFDERQATANAESSERAALDAQQAESEQVRTVIEELQTNHQQLSAAYEERVTAYEERLSAYNAKVQKYNDRGGAPSDVFAELEDERSDLSAEASTLSATASDLNQLASRINELGERGNRLVDEYNEAVKEYNDHYGFAREFTQGDYQRDNINVYKFSSEKEVVLVLVHEFGHALGIGHVEGESSIMYYLLEHTDGSLALSANDLAAYYAVCGYEPTTGQRVRQAVRNILTKF